MKLIKYLSTGILTSTALILSSCVDNNYDLSDIDTTARFVTKDLVVPMNIEKVTLDQVLDINDNSEIITELINGKKQYAILKEGTFKSNPVNVHIFTSSKPSTEKKTSELNITYADNPATQGFTAYYDINIEPSEINFTSDNVDNSIIDIKRLGVEASYSNKVKIEGLNKNQLANVTIENLVIKYPKGFEGTPSIGTYDKSTGILTIPEIKPDNNGEFEIKYEITGIDVENSNINLDLNKHNLTLKDKFEVLDGKIIVNIDNQFPSTIKIHNIPDMSEITVKTVTGELEYEVEDTKIEDVNFSNIPDLINQSGTKIVLDNPQLYLNVNNPLSEYDLYVQSGFKLTTMRDKQAHEYSPENILATDKGVNDNYFVLSPKNPDTYYTTYKNVSNIKHVQFSTLGHVLADVEGIPNTVKVQLIDEKIPAQSVTDLELGKIYEPIKGSYTFYAPLTLTEESSIVYTDTLDGWNDKEVDNITISDILVTFDGSTDVPFDMDLTVMPIGIDGKVIPNVTSSTAKVNAKAKEQPIELSVKGEIKHFDGILIKAYMKQKTTDTLSPEMDLKMNKFKVKISGYYDKEL